MNTIDFLKGKKTYLIAAALGLVVLVEKGLGIDVPGVVVDDNWLVVLANGAGLGTLRAGISNSLWGRS